MSSQRDTPAGHRAGWRLQQSYREGLPAIFYTQTAPTPVNRPGLALFNVELAGDLGLDPDHFEEPAGAAELTGNTLPQGAEPLAQAYAGHQFGHFTMLGDGRALVLGEQMAPDGSRWDVQYKGSGPTPFSRRGDGRAALGPMLREYLVSESLHALGIPTTRSLAVATTGESVYRETPLPGAVLTRVAASHIRVGTFQYAAAQRPQQVKALADYTLERHYPDIAPDPDRYCNLLERFLERQIRLVAQWLGVGFIHGVMNTDNVALSGETIDYGPCAFMDTYDPATVFSSIDHHGRYAYGNQARIALWNGARFAETLLPLLSGAEKKAVQLAEEILLNANKQFEAQWLTIFHAKLGGLQATQADKNLIRSLLTWMQTHQADFINTFAHLTVLARTRANGQAPPPSNAPWNDETFAAWCRRWQAHCDALPGTPASKAALMQTHNPTVIPRNHQVESALAAAVTRLDFAPLQQLLTVCKQPYNYDLPPADTYRTPAPPDWARTFQTFCGT